jgi:hypothetical protein
MEILKMKKQLIAAAVASSVSAIALADISITGALKTNYTHTDYEAATANDSDIFSHEADLMIKGKSGDTTVVMNFGGMDFNSETATSISDGTAATGATVSTFQNATWTTSTHTAGTNGTSGTLANNKIDIEDLYLTTKVGDISLKAGQWDNGNNELRASSRKGGKFEASTSMGGIDVKYANGNAADDEVTVGTSLGGVSVSYTDKNAGNAVKASTTVGGVALKYYAENSDSTSADRVYYEASTTVGDVAVKIGKAEAEVSATIDGDTWMGDFEGASGAYALSAGQDVTSIELATSVAGNKVTFRNTQVSDKANEDTSFNKVIVTRPLASGATFELTYTDLSDDGSTSTDATTLDLELAVSF